MVIDFNEAKKRINKEKQNSEEIHSNVNKAEPENQEKSCKDNKKNTTESPQCRITFNSYNTIFFYEADKDGKYNYIAQSSVFMGKRTFHRRTPGSPYIEAKDCTRKKIEADPHYYILKYLPDWEGKRVRIGYSDSIILKKVDAPTKSTSPKIDPSKLDFQFKVGDILYTSWGYDQTNVDFFQIISRTARTAKVRQIASEIVERHENSSSARVKPVKDKFVDDKIKSCRIRVHANREVSLCNVDGLDNTGRLHNPGTSHSCSWGH